MEIEVIPYKEYLNMCISQLNDMWQDGYEVNISRDKKWAVFTK